MIEINIQSSEKNPKRFIGIRKLHEFIKSMPYTPKWFMKPEKIHYNLQNPQKTLRIIKINLEWTEKNPKR